MRPQFNKMFHVLYKECMKFAVLNPNYDHCVIKYLMLCSQWVLTLLRVTYWMLKSFKYLTTIESISLITVVCVHSAVFSAFLFVLSYNLFSISCVIMCSFYYLVISPSHQPFLLPLFHFPLL